MNHDLRRARRNGYAQSLEAELSPVTAGGSAGRPSLYYFPEGESPARRESLEDGRFQDRARSLRSKVQDTINRPKSGNRKPSSPETLAIVFQKFGPYHVDRINATQRLVGDHVRLVGVEISDGSTTYEWDRATSNDFERVTLFPGESWEAINPFRRLSRILSCLRQIEAKHVLLINYQFIDIFLAALALRMLGKRPYIMMASKFTDKERSLRLEKFKRFLFLPYVGGIASGESHLAYLKFLGVKTKNFHVGLDTLSGERVRQMAGREPAPGGEPFESRHFTIIARMVPEKDIPTAIHAYARYCDLCEAQDTPARDLVLCGDGPERGEIETLVEDYGLTSVIFRGFVQEREVCESLATTLALVLPSREEPWGLVINESISMGVPILCSNVCGACDDLVRTGVNGFVFSPGEAEGLAHLMMMVSSEEDEWKRLCLGSLRMAPRADASRFGQAVVSTLQLESQAE